MIRHKVKIDKDDKLSLWRAEYRRTHKEDDKFPPGYDKVSNGIYKEHDVFCTMVKAFIRDGSFDIHGIIYSYWKSGFKRPFPKEGGSLFQLCTMIRLKLLKKGFENQDLLYDDKDLDEIILKRFPRLIPNKMKDFYINPHPKEDFVARKDKDKKKKKGYSASEDDDDEDTTSKKKKRRSRPDDDDPPKKKKKKSKDGGDRAKSGACRLLCAELLLTRKYTDEEISEMVEDEVGIPYSVARVNRIREGINEGVRGEPPDPPLEPIEEGGKKKKKKKKSDDDDDPPKKKKKGKKKNRKRDDDDD